MKTLPYFKWYPADAEMDAKYRAMDDAERGFYLACLNYAWINGGLPANPDERARVLGRRRSLADRRWLRVGPCFQPSESDSTLLVNPRQERERNAAVGKSEKSQTAARVRWDVQCERNADAYADAMPRALARADCVSVSGSSLEFVNQKKTANRARDAISGAFATFWARWCELTHRKQRESNACQAWISVVDPGAEVVAMACLERYGRSDEVARGVITSPDKWIYEQARDKWAGDWPPARAAPLTRAEKQKLADQELAQRLGLS